MQNELQKKIDEALQREDLSQEKRQELTAQYKEQFEKAREMAIGNAKKLAKEQRFLVWPSQVPELKEMGLLPTRTITWDVFEKQTAEIHNAQKKARNEDLLAQKELAKFFSIKEFVSLTQTPHAGLPDYGKLTKGERYIYVVESSGHDQSTIIREGSRILQSIREANPGKQILLAWEMASLLDQGVSPFFSYPQKGIYIDAPYKQLAETAKRQNMDILALDDIIFQAEPTPDTYSVKVGSYAVRFNTTAPYVKKFVSQYPKGYQYDPTAVIQDLLFRSDWGVKQRNDQWARYIKAVQDSYDIIIVYAGNGHVTDSYSANNLPEKIAKKGTVILLSSAEQLPQGDQQFYDCVNNAQCKYNLTSVNAFSTFEEQILMEQYLQIEPFIKQLQEGKPFWIEIISDLELGKYVLQRAPKEKQEKLSKGVSSNDFKTITILLP